MKRCLGIIQLLLVSLFFDFVPLYAEINSFLVKIDLELKPQAEQFFQNCAEYFIDETDIEKYFNTYFTEKSQSGFVVTDKEGDNFIITSAAKLTYAVAIDLSLSTEDNQPVRFKNCKVLFIDESSNLAVLRFPYDLKVLEDGLDFYDDKLSEGMKIHIPSLARQDNGGVTWNMIQGQVESSKIIAPSIIDPKISLLLKHSIPLDDINDGSPLLVYDEKRQDYLVAGINIIKKSINEKHIFSVPIPVIQTAMQKSVKIIENKSQCLYDSCLYFTSEIETIYPDFKKLASYLSDSYVLKAGWEMLAKSNLSSSELKEIEHNLAVAPLKTLKMIIARYIWQFWADENRPGISFKSINKADEAYLNERNTVRTSFLINNQETEILWTFSPGHLWQITHIELNPAKSEEFVLQKAQDEIAESTQYVGSWGLGAVGGYGFNWGIFA